MAGVYVTNPFPYPWMANYPHWPFHDVEFWHLGNIIYEVLAQEIDFPAGVPLRPTRNLRIRARDAFLCSGILMSPSTLRAGPGAWGFFLEHIDSLRPNSGRLRLQPDVIEWDERTRTIFAERFSLGLAGWLLWNSYDVLHIADAGPFIGKTLDDPASPFHRKSLQSLGLYGKNGGFKPDLFCLTKAGECIVAESKGAIGAPSKLTSDKRKGKKQVKNVEPIGVPLKAKGGRLVFATNLRHAGENAQPSKDSCICVVDPDGGDEPLHVKVRPDEIARHSYCKLLSMCGLSHIAGSILRGASLGVDQVFQQEPTSVEGLKVLPLLQTPNQILGLEKGIAHTLFNNREGLASDIQNHLLRLEIGPGRSTESAFVLPNGVVYASNQAKEFAHSQQENLRR